jgi:hypothetical protein
VTNNIEWPSIAGQQPEFIPAEGIKHHYCRLALLRLDEEVRAVLDDCRHFFLSVSSLSLGYVSGDGQEASVGERLPAELQALVTTGDKPVNGVQVKFHIETGQGGGLEPPDDDGGDDDGDDDNATNLETCISKSDENGIAKCSWTMGSSPTSQQVKANILDAEGNPVGLPVYFNANLALKTGGVSAKTGILRLRLEPPPAGARLVIFSQNSDTGFVHNSGDLGPPAIVLGMTGLGGATVQNHETVDFMEDHRPGFPFPLLFKALNIDREFFSVSIDAFSVNGLLSLGYSHIFLRWWAISGEEQNDQEGRPTSSQLAPTIVARPSTISIRNQQAAEIQVFDPARNTNRDRREEFKIRLVGTSDDDLRVSFVPVTVRETDTNTAVFSNKIRVTSNNVIQVADNNQGMDLLGARAGKTIVAIHEISEGKLISADIHIVE